MEATPLQHPAAPLLARRSPQRTANCPLESEESEVGDDAPRRAVGTPESERRRPSTSGEEEEEEEEESTGEPLRARPDEVRSRFSWFMLRKQMSEEEARGRGGGRGGARAKRHRPPSRSEQQPEEGSPRVETGEDTRCGFGGWQPQWLQRCLSKKTYVLAHGITGMSYGTLASYYNANISTLEKQFKISSRTSGVVSSAWDVGTLMSVLAMGYFGTRGHKPRLMAVGALLVAASCFVRLLPQLIYGPGRDALQLTHEHGDGAALGSGGAAGGSLCGAAAAPDCAEQRAVAPLLPAAFMFLAHFMQGIGTSVYWTLGLAYLDDNTTKNKAPVAHAMSQFLRLLGPTFGYTFASYTLSKYVDLTATPRIDNTDPRWIGAWWLGWGPLGGVVTLLACAMLLFPRRLPRAVRRRELRLRQEARAPASSKNFFQAFHHLLKNKILVCNTFSAVFFFFGNTGYWIFMPKYMETLYHQSSSRASLITGSIGLASAGLGLIASGVVIARYKPRARYLAAWNVIVETAEALCKFSWMFLDCGERLLQGGWGQNGTWNMTADCNADCACGPEVKYSPVCSMEGGASFYSPCHAGCSSSMEALNGTRIFSNCSCIPSGMAVDGPCTMNCVTNFTIFLVSQCIISFLAASGKAGNVLIMFRCVHEDDKPLAIALSEFLLAALAFMPAPIVFGALVDYTCLVWGETCGKTGNCWLYDDQKLRYLINLTGSSLMIAGAFFDAGVCYYAKELKIYDEDDETELRNKDSVLNNTP